MAINNTHYNLIDTLINAYGQNVWNDFCKVIVPQLKSANGIKSFGNALWIADGENFPGPVWYTICECIYWAIADGDYYRIPKV